jgi:hypothetical protein
MHRNKVISSWKSDQDNFIYLHAGEVGKRIISE